MFREGEGRGRKNFRLRQLSQDVFAPERTPVIWQFGKLRQRCLDVSRHNKLLWYRLIQYEAGFDHGSGNYMSRLETGIRRLSVFFLSG